MEGLPNTPFNTSKESHDYNPYRDPTSVFYGLDENFIPTPEKPIQQPRCANISRDGELCDERAVLGTGYAGVKPLCAIHGGNTKGVQSKARDIVEAARLMLTSSVPSALDNLVRLATDKSIAQNVQLSAIKEILDRAGVKADNTQKIEVEITQSPTDKIMDRLNKLRTIESEPEEPLEDLGEQ